MACAGRTGRRGLLLGDGRAYASSRGGCRSRGRKGGREERGPSRRAAPRPQLRLAPAGAARRRGQHRVAGGLLLLQLQDVQVGEPGDGDYEKPVAGEQRRSVFAGGRVPRRVAGVVGRGQRRQPPRGSVHLQLPQAPGDGAAGLAAAAVRQAQQLGGQDALVLFQRIIILWRIAISFAEGTVNGFGWVFYPHHFRTFFLF